MSLFLIAEIGINHNGSVELAKELITAAHGAGFDAVKFQKRDIDEVYSASFLASPRKSPWGTTQREQKDALELSLEDYQAIDAHCKQLGIAWFASAWDNQSQTFLHHMQVPYNKIASPLLSNLALVEQVAHEGKRTFVSTGMSTLDEIDSAIGIFEQANCPYEIMHCNSTYPMPLEEANLACIPMLKARYGCPVGYSGHEEQLTDICIAAVALGATSIERHITLDKTLYGSDQAASIEVADLETFVRTVRSIPSALGTGVKIITDTEQSCREKLRVTVCG